MQPNSIQDARLNRIDIDVKTSFVKRRGTSITKRTNIFRNRIITGITATKNDAKVTLVGVKDKPGVAASVFKPLSQNYINVDMVVQTSSSNNRETDITFTIKSEDLSKTLKFIKQNKKIKLGICGEHGGDPKSIEFRSKVGLDYVSCSPYRIPVARLAAAQAELKKFKNVV